MKYLFLTFLLLLVLKAMVVVSWSWWIIFTPLILGGAVIALTLASATYAMANLDKFWSH